MTKTPSGPQVAVHASATSATTETSLGPSGVCFDDRSICRNQTSRNNAALKISAPLALIGAVVAEWTGASGGLGRIMWLAYSNLNLPFLFAAIFLLAAFGMILYWLLASLEYKIIFWSISIE